MTSSVPSIFRLCLVTHCVLLLVSIVVVVVVVVDMRPHIGQLNLADRPCISATYMVEKKRRALQAGIVR